MINLRRYQEQCLADLATHRAEHPDETRLAVVMPTGLGKTITFAAEADRWLWDARNNVIGHGWRVLILTHTDELASQAEAKVRLMVGDRWTVGVVKAERNDVQADIVIGSVQTLANPARRAQLTDVGHIIVDECHHAIAPAYVAILRWYEAMDAKPSCGEDFCDDCGDCMACFGDDPCRNDQGHDWWSAPTTTTTGYTATLERGDGNSLGSVWQNVAFSRSISWAVRKGFLVPPRAYRVEVPDLDIWNGRGSLSGAELIDGALIDSIAPESVVDAWMDHAKGRSTVLFAPLVRSARAFTAAFNDRGVQAAVIHGDMPTEDRRTRLAAYEAGEIQVICNAMVLTEGWDSPRTECVIVARPTQSRPLFIQMAGRGLRPWFESLIPREEQDCVLLVVADATTELASMADLSDRPIVAEDGKSLLALEDEFDLSKDLEPDPEHAYDGKVHVSEFDPLVVKSSKVWNRTAAGTWFLPAGNRTWVFLMQEAAGWSVCQISGGLGGRVQQGIPDIELAMSLAEDAATDLGGNLTALYADKGRAWRKAVPSEDMKAYAIRLGLERDMERILGARAGGKAGKLSDLIDKVVASRRIDPVVARIQGVAR